MCCFGCGYCAVNIRPAPEYDELDDEIQMPDRVVMQGIGSEQPVQMDNQYTQGNTSADNIVYQQPAPGINYAVND